MCVHSLTNNAKACYYFNNSVDYRLETPCELCEKNLENKIINGNTLRKLSISFRTLCTESAYAVSST